MKKVVAVIGAGSSGLAAIKACKEEGIDVVCFEKYRLCGGLWRHHENSEDGRPSVMKSTVINTHKEMTAFSDFPPPDNSPNYMHNTQLLKYFESYANRFELLQHIRFQQEVISVSKAKDYYQTGQWIVTARSRQNHVVSEEVFDGVMVCSGHHAFENMPKLPGQASFQGRVLHSHSVKTPDAFKDLNVLVVGIGNSAVDAAVEISNVAKQVYLSTRRGAWIVPRCGENGLPVDAAFNNRMLNNLVSLFGWERISWLCEKLFINSFFNHELYGLKPKHRLLSQHPTINDHLPSKIFSGRIIVKRDVETFTSEGVKFKRENVITPTDAVIFATGYKIKFPFIKEPFCNIEGNRVNLYKFTFPPYLKHPSLAFIGLCQPFGSIMPISEAQSRWFALAINGRVELPSMERMIGDVRKRRKVIEDRFVESPRHTIQVDFVPFMDAITSEFGAKPNLLKMIITDPILFLICWLGPCLPYQYRLQGPHSWSRARETILKFPVRVSKPLSGGVTEPRFSHFEMVKLISPNLFQLLIALLNIYLVILFVFLMA